MFNFFSKKIKDKDINKYNLAIKAIKIYTSLGLFAKAIIACDEIIEKERISLESLIKTLKNEKNWDSIIKKETKIFNNKKETVNKLRQKAKVLEIKYKEKIEKARFKKIFKETRKDVKNLTNMGKNLEAMNQLKAFLNANKNNIDAISFYNKEKKVIQAHIEKEKIELRKWLKNDAKAEAMELIWEKIEKKEEKKEEKEKVSFFSKVLNFLKLKDYSNLLNKIKKEKILNEVEELLEKKSKEKEELAKIRLESVHKWLIKEIKYDRLIWYDVYWKILWADKISGDTFGINEKDKSYTLFLWDATWHGIKAWFIVTLLNKSFREYRSKNLKEMVFKVNNSLKQSLESKNFITWAFFDINKKTWNISYVWMWHEPIIFYNKSKEKAEKKVLWGLAAWIRIIRNKDDVKIKNLEMDDWDLFVIFSDWIIEAKNDDWDFYWIDRLQENVELVANSGKNLKQIYDYLINDLKLFRWWTRFDDDVSMLIVKRDKEKDVVKKWDEFMEKVVETERLNRRELKQLEWKTKKEINEKIRERRKKIETERVVQILKNIYYNWEILKLKQEAIRYVKEWFIDRRINNYLKKALDNEKAYKIEQKNQKMINKYKVLEELLKKWKYDIVIEESEDIIAKDWWF